MVAKKSFFHICSVIFIMVFMLAEAPLQAVQAAGIRYAKPATSGSGNCSSWANACTLQTALTGVTSGNEIWVMTGTHKPTTGTDRTATFQLKTGVAIYGGFAGTETARDQRNPSANLTILSGDIDNNDDQTPVITDLATETNNSANSYHVVTGATGATLDGFTITAGNANVGDDCPSTTTSCGGGMYNQYSSPILMNVIFSGNSANGGGGGLFNYAGSFPTLTDVTFNGNWAIYGGGMYNYSGGGPLTNVSFNGNSARNGGGMNNISSYPELMNVTFSGNQASYVGGGMYNYSSQTSLTNVTFSSNSANSSGGGIYNYYSSDTTLTNVTITGNTAGDGGSGMTNNADITYSCDPTVQNTIFWNNTDPTGDQIFNKYCSTSVSDSVVQGGYTDGTNIIATDPDLGTLGNYGGLTQTVPLLAGSSAIDTGDDSVCPPTDQRGVPRPQGLHCDIGAFEVDPTPPTVISIVRINPNPTNLASVGYTVTFSEPVTGVDTSDFALTVTGVTDASIAGVSGGPTAYTVTVNTGNGVGTLRLDLNASGTNIRDLAGNPISAGFTSGEVYTINKTYTITGNAGDAGVLLSYTDGTPKTVTSRSDGRYTITVPYNWSGPVTPSKTGVTFTPPNRTYTPITANQTAQNYNDTITLTTTGTYDGWILESAKGSGLGGSLNATATTFQLGDDASNRQYRASLSFNTASLPDTATITSAVLKIKQSGSISGSNPFSLFGGLYADIKKGYFGTSSALQVTDFNASATASKVCAFGKTPASGWYTATLTSTGRADVNKTSLTQFRLYFSQATNTNNKADYMKFLSGNSASNPAELIITYSLP